MAILSLQRRLSEVGRIRLGQQIESKGGKKRPAALTTFRLTSGDKARIEEAAQLYGGKVTQWDAPSGLAQWEVITESDKLPVVVPPSAMSFSQHYEQWSAGGCQRRCDGVTETLSEQPCLCDPDNRACEIHTRLSVMLRDLSGLGVWRVDTQGYYAALELQGAVEVISLAAGRGQMLPATLRLDPRVIKRADEGTKRFVVPVLDIEATPAMLLMGTVGVSQAAVNAGVAAAPSEPAQRALTPVPDGGPTPSIADQVQASEQQPSRRRASTQVIPSPGLAPRTAAQAQSTASTKKYTSRVTDTFAPDEAPEPEPRMSTGPQLQKLGILLTNQGFKSTDEGRAQRLDFCRAALKQLFPESLTAGRAITSSKELTFDEAHGLIDMMEKDEAQERKRQTEQERRERDNAIQDMAEGVTPYPAAEPVGTVQNPEDEPPAEDAPAEDPALAKFEPPDLDAAAEQLRQRRSEQTADDDDDSPHGPGCEPGCTLSEGEHPPVEPANDQPAVEISLPDTAGEGTLAAEIETNTSEDQMTLT